MPREAIRKKASLLLRILAPSLLPTKTESKENGASYNSEMVMG